MSRDCIGRHSGRIVGGLWMYAGFGVQHFSPGRDPSVEHVAAPALGALCAGLSVFPFGRAFDVFDARTTPWYFKGAEPAWNPDDAWCPLAGCASSTSAAESERIVWGRVRCAPRVPYIDVWRNERAPATTSEFDGEAYCAGNG
jgi:hypothetical protein